MAFSKTSLLPVIHTVRANAFGRVIIDAIVNTLAFPQFAYIAKLQTKQWMAISIYLIGVALQTLIYVQIYYIGKRDDDPKTGSFMTNPTTCIVLYILITFATNMGSVYSEFEYRNQQAKEQAERDAKEQAREAKELQDKKDREAKELQDKKDREAKELQDKKDREEKHERQIQLMKEQHEQMLAALEATHGPSFIQASNIAVAALDNYNKKLFKKHRELIASEIIGNIDKLDVMERYDLTDHATEEELNIDTDL